MNNEVVYSRLALLDLDRVSDEVYQASGEKAVADRYVFDLMDKIQAKAPFPRSGAPLYWNDFFTGYYYVVFKKYLAFYRVEKDQIFVARVLHQKSDYRILLAGEAN